MMERLLNWKYSFGGVVRIEGVAPTPTQPVTGKISRWPSTGACSATTSFKP
jgi:hypothetical protein